MSARVEQTWPNNKSDNNHNEITMTTRRALGALPQVIDIETRAEIRSPLLGHENFIHSLSQCSVSGQVASASEDGTARIWDTRTKSGHIATLNPGQNPNLNRAKLGDWLGAASLSGDFLAVGGGPQPALWHMRTRSPQEPYLPPDIASNSNK